MTEKQDFSIRFERMFVRMVFDEIKRRGMSKREMVRYVYPDKRDPDRIAQALEKGSYPAKGYKPKRFTLAESYRVADFLRIDYVALIAAVIGETLREQGALKVRPALPSPIPVPPASDGANG